MGRRHCEGFRGCCSSQATFASSTTGGFRSPSSLGTKVASSIGLGRGQYRSRHGCLYPRPASFCGICARTRDGFGQKRYPHCLLTHAISLDISMPPGLIINTSSPAWPPSQSIRAWRKTQGRMYEVSQCVLLRLQGYARRDKLAKPAPRRVLRIETHLRTDRRVSLARRKALPRRE